MHNNIYYYQSIWLFIHWWMQCDLYVGRKLKYTCVSRCLFSYMSFFVVINNEIIHLIVLKTKNIKYNSVEHNSSSSSPVYYMYQTFSVILSISNVLHCWSDLLWLVIHWFAARHVPGFVLDCMYAGLAVDISGCSVNR